MLSRVLSRAGSRRPLQSSKPSTRRYELRGSSVSTVVGLARRPTRASQSGNGSPAGQSLLRWSPFSSSCIRESIFIARHRDTGFGITTRRGFRSSSDGPWRARSSLGQRGATLFCARFVGGALDPLAQLHGRGSVEPADGLYRNHLLFECLRELRRGRHPPQQRCAAPRWERSIRKGGQVAGGAACHCSTIGSVAVSAAPPGLGVSLTRSMSRTGTGVAMPQLPLMSLNGARVSVLPVRVTICSLYGGVA